MNKKIKVDTENSLSITQHAYLKRMMPSPLSAWPQEKKKPCTICCPDIMVVFCNGCHICDDYKLRVTI